MEPSQSLYLSDLSPEQLDAAVVAAVATGVLYCFLGHRTLKFIVGLTGFLFAGAVAGFLAGWASNGHLIAMAAAMAIGGVAGAVALLFLYKVGIFLLGLLAATLVAHSFLIDRPEAWVPFAVLGLGILGGAVALFIERPVMIVATATMGAWAVVSGLGYFFFKSDLPDQFGRALSDSEQHIFILVCWALLTAAGAFTQFATRKRKGAKGPG